MLRASINGGASWSNISVVVNAASLPDQSSFGESGATIGNPVTALVETRNVTRSHPFTRRSSRFRHSFIDEIACI